MSFAQQGHLFRPISGSTERSLWVTQLRTTAFKPPSSIIEWPLVSGQRSQVGILRKSKIKFFMSFAQQGDLFRPISGSTERSLWATELRTTAFKPPSSIIEWHPLCGERSPLGILWKSKIKFCMYFAQQGDLFRPISGSTERSLWATELRTTAFKPPSSIIEWPLVSGQRSQVGILRKSKI